jgi:predicted  nucleic acid-binding Zn-ribbon protein
MKKFFIFLIAGFFLLSAICLDVSAAKKSSKISKEAVQEMSDNIDNLTKVDLSNVTNEDIDEYYANSNTYSSELFMVRRNLDNIIKKIKDMLEEFDNTKNNIIKAKNKFNESKNQYDSDIEKITPKCNEIRQKMVVLQDKIDKNLFSKYQTLRNDKIFPVFVKLKDNHYCGGCRVELPMAKINKIKDTKMIVCDQCHRFIINE